MHRRVLALCVAVAFLTPTAPALAQRNNQQQQQPKRSKAEQADIEALSSAVDFAAVGKAATDVTLKWDMHHFMKNPDGATVFPFVISVDKAARRIAVSVKALELAEEKQAVAQYGSSDSGASLGDIFKAAIKKREGAEDSE